MPGAVPASVVLEDRFDRASLGQPWTTAVSTRPKATLKLDGGAIRIEASANNFALTERPLPPGVTLVECGVYSGSDKGASWGPGIALVWKNKPLRTLDDLETCPYMSPWKTPSRCVRRPWNSEGIR